ncbi:MAG: glycosyltransferase family 2 protein [Candidatus Melainabacteria bacterium]|nr:glycosyltransferase family 2 protein [Candidatus Melainabacteria bacterium]
MAELKTQVELSVIICTRNRARQLAILIQCLGSQKDIENLNWEIVIVDNNSSDNTKEVAYAFCEGSNLKVNYIFEPKTGLSYARNTGVLASKGSLVLFIDDDVLIPKEFLNNTLFGIQEFPEFHIFGFRILPEWPEPPKAGLRNPAFSNPAFKPPFWLTFKKPFQLIQSFLPVHDLGVEPLQYPNSKARNPIGACFIVKKEVFEKLGPFREDLGAGQSGVCEDTEFFWYALLNKFKILYWPYAALYHPVLPERLTVSYLHKWYFNLGKSLYLVNNTGRAFNVHKKHMMGIEGFIANKLPSIFGKILLKTKILNISIYLWAKLLLLVLLLPFTILLFLIKRPFYLTTMIARVSGEIRQGMICQV